MEFIICYLILAISFALVAWGFMVFRRALHFTEQERKILKMIYYIPPASPKYERLFKDVEKALGFKLFAWQKTYILYGIYRRTGKTTAECLRELLEEDHCPIDYTLPPRNPREEIHRKELLKIKKKLSDAGIWTTPVFTTKVEKQTFEATKKILLNIRKENRDPETTKPLWKV